MESFSQSKITDRQPVASGRFYPAGKEELTSDLSRLFTSCKKTAMEGRVRAVITPHAGYVFSGETAAAAFSSIPRDAVYRNIFIIGSSHVMAFDGASVWNTGDYLTPLGRAKVNREITGKLMENKVFGFSSNAHFQEHSIEVQVPFIQYYFRDTPPIIPVIIGTDDENIIKQIADALMPWFNDDNLFVISSDFSHYPAYADAVESDRRTALAIASGDPAVFLKTLKDNASKRIKGQVTSMCGWTSGLALLYMTRNNPEYVYHLVDYSNSGDSKYGGKNEVVGYNAISVTVKEGVTKKLSAEEFSFNASEKEQLFSIARNSVREKLEGRDYRIPTGNITPKLKEAMGAFVTIKIKGALRGCIGRFISTAPLYEVVKASALSSAFEDPRFSPLSREEYPGTSFEITVLGPLKKINDYHEIVLGRHGIYIKKNGRAGTMLPQVATENNWTLEQFLGYTSRDKAGLGWDGWKDAELFIYEGVVLEENR